MSFNSKISLKQSGGIFYFLLGLIIIYSVYVFPQSYKNWLLILGVVFIVQGITDFSEGTKKRRKILTATSDGEYDSNSEREVGEYFKRKKIKFNLHPVLKFPTKIWIFDNPFKKIKLKPDFYLPEYDLYVEYWGMMDKEEYKRRYDEKMKLYKEYDIRVISLYERNLDNLDWNFTQKLLNLFREEEGNNLWGN